MHTVERAPRWRVCVYRRWGCVAAAWPPNKQHGMMEGEDLRGHHMIFSHACQLPSVFLPLVGYLASPSFPTLIFEALDREAPFQNR